MTLRKVIQDLGRQPTEQTLLYHVQREIYPVLKTLRDAWNLLALENPDADTPVVIPPQVTALVWSTELDFDWTAQADEDIGSTTVDADGYYTVGGKSWYFRNFTPLTSSVYKVINGTGLRLASSTPACTWIPGTRNGPFVGIHALEAHSAFRFAEYQHRAWWHFSTTLAGTQLNNGPMFWVGDRTRGIIDATKRGVAEIVWLSGSGSANEWHTLAEVGANSRDAADPDGVDATHDVVMIHQLNAHASLWYTGTWDTANDTWPALSTMKPHGLLLATDGTRGTDSGAIFYNLDAGVMYGMANVNNASSAYTTDIKHMRVDAKAV